MSPASVEVRRPGAAAAGRAWLLPAVARISDWAVRLYYRATLAGEAPPARGPVLFVANHPNSGFDPAFVAACARRPVRFLAKATLFQRPVIGRLLQACGAIPIYRRRDDASLMDLNVQAFDAVQAALADGNAVGIFPEGISHTGPSLAPLRTGAARIALGAAQDCGEVFPIVPVGIFLRYRERFRSEAVAVVGHAVSWSALADRGPDDADAVRELTSRIDAALRDVTLNLEGWEDAPAVRLAGEVYAAEFALPDGREDQLRRERLTAAALSRLRRRNPERLRHIAEAVERFSELLSVVGARPADIGTRWSPRAAARWLARNATLLFVGGPFALVGHVVFFVPYRLTDLIGTRENLDPDIRSTVKLLGGAVVYGVWIVGLATVAGFLLRPRVGLLLLGLLPPLGLLTLLVRERWRDDRARLQRVIRFRRAGDLQDRLLLMRRELAASLESARWDLQDEAGRADRPGEGDEGDGRPRP